MSYENSTMKLLVGIEFLIGAKIGLLEVEKWSSLFDKGDYEIYWYYGHFELTMLNNQTMIIYDFRLKL